MSLEAALDEERREVMNILEGRSTPARTQANSSMSHNGGSRASAPPVRSMLDVGDPNTTSPSGTSNSGVRSMLDIGETEPGRNPRNVMALPGAPRASGAGLYRARSDASETRPRVGNDRDGVDLNTDYQFSMLPSIQNQALPKRVTQGGKKPNIGSMTTIVQGQEMSALSRGRDSTRHGSAVGMGGGSMSPSGLYNRSRSPGGRLMPTPGKFVTESGKVIDMNSAYRKLSDTALLNSGGELATLPIKPASSRALARGETLSPTGEVRLQKDPYPSEGDGAGAAESSEEDEPRSGSSGDDGWGSSSVRGRKRGRKSKETGKGGGDREDSDLDARAPEGSVGLGKAPGPRKVKSLLAAAEEERLNVSSGYRVRSLLEPVVTVTEPNDEKVSSRNSGVHPDTNYDQTISGRESPVTSSDSGELKDIQRAQRLNISSTPIDNSIPHRVIRTIIRGDFPQMQREAKEGLRRLRTYLVATDLSGEAAYALEWTIGTVLRDGDTLIAVYAVDEETGMGKSGEDGIQCLPIGEGAKSMQDTAAMVEKMTLAAQSNPSGPGLLPTSAFSLAPGSHKNSSATSTDSRHLSKAEHERFHAIEGITQTCVKFLRKTKLQVRIAVEVIHCKSPKHMITEAIDGLEPTLVVLGSRGRSALKGVLLGSFSNYLVTKSSVPVMVARKRLSGRKAKQASPNVQLANNLVPGKPFSWDPIKVD